MPKKKPLPLVVELSHCGRLRVSHFLMRLLYETWGVMPLIAVHIWTLSIARSACRPLVHFAPSNNLHSITPSSTTTYNPGGL